MNHGATMAETCIRWAVRRDLEDVVEIDRRSYVDPWDEEDYLRALRRFNVIHMVAERGGRVVGSMIYRLPPREIFVVRFAVHPDFRRMGVGSAMVAKLRRKLDGRDRVKVVASVQGGNRDGQSFLRACGWRARRFERNAFVPGVDGFDFELTEGGKEGER